MKTNLIIAMSFWIIGVVSFKPVSNYLNPAAYDTKGMNALTASVQPIDYLEAK